MAGKNYPDGFKRDAVALYRDTEGATIAVIAAELGVSEATLSAWCKAAGVPIRHRRPAPAAVTSPGVETPEQELARLRAENQQLRAEKTVRLCGSRHLGESVSARCYPVLQGPPLPGRDH